MITKGKLISVAKSLTDDNFIVTLSTESCQVAELIGEEITADIKKYRKQRSKNANALLWECLDEIATKIGSDKQKVYHEMLMRYGQWSSIEIEESALEEFTTHCWKDVEEVGRYESNGKAMVSLLCYYGSSTYDSKEFYKLLSGVISEAKEMGFIPNCEMEVNALLEKYEKENAKKINPCEDYVEYDVKPTPAVKEMNRNFSNTQQNLGSGSGLVFRFS